MRRAVCMPVSLAFALCAGADGAFVVDDRSFFDGKEHVFLDFETRGDGTPVDLFFNSGELMSTDEYAASGVLFTTQWGWQHVGSPPSTGSSIAVALEAIGSWPTAIGGPGDTYRIGFITPVHAFGIGVVQGGFADQGEPSAEFTSTITAFDADGEILGVARLWEDLIDGGTGGVYAGGEYGDEWMNILYGFLGLATEEPIAMLEFTNVRDSIFDDLHFSAVPAPGAGAAFGLLALGALTRRRRR